MPLFNVDHCLVSLLAGWYALILLNILIRSPVWDVRKKLWNLTLIIVG